MFRPVRISPPAKAPIHVDDAKVFLRVDGADDDVLIQGLIAAAVDHLDGRTGLLGRCLVTQVWQYKTIAFQRKISLGMPGATAAVVRYLDRDGAMQELSGDDIALVEEVRGSCIVFADHQPVIGWHGPATIDVTFGTAEDKVPAAIVQAIRMLVAHWYANREAVTTGSAAAIPMGVDMLIAPYRWISI
jgi:uncharacterized phiE125 gp8 family phage protein